MAACAAAAVAAPPAAAQARLHEIGRFAQPVYAAGAPGDYRRLYVVEKAGVVRVVRDGRVLPAPFVDLTGSVSSEGERGLLSIAFAPDFQRSRLLYVYFTDREGDIRVEQLTARGPESADRGARRLVIEIEHRAFSNHNGGTIQFGRDGYLYLAPGDGGGGNDPFDNAQNLDSLLGKVLRIAPRPGGGYDVPRENPHVGQAGRHGEIWSHGLRNPYRFSFDRDTGDLTLGDAGQNTTEEIDYVPASQGAGRGSNFGWDRCEGSFATGTTNTPCPIASTLPVIDHFNRDGWSAVIGGYVVRDRSLGELYGRYVYGDLAQSELHSARLATPRAQDDRGLGLRVGSLVSFGEDTAGCVYAISIEGPVYRLVRRSTAVPCPDPAAPRLRVRVPRRQSVRRAVVAYARCNEDCTISMGTRVRVGRRTFRVRAVRRRAWAGRRVRIRARLRGRARRSARRAVRRRRAVGIRVSLRARDAAGNRSSLVRRRLRLRR